MCWCNHEKHRWLQHLKNFATQLSKLTLCRCKKNENEGHTHTHTKLFTHKPLKVRIFSELQKQDFPSKRFAGKLMDRSEPGISRADIFWAEFPRIPPGPAALFRHLADIFSVVFYSKILADSQNRGLLAERLPILEDFLVNACMQYHNCAHRKINALKSKTKTRTYTHTHINVCVCVCVCVHANMHVYVYEMEQLLRFTSYAHTELLLMKNICGNLNWATIAYEWKVYKGSKQPAIN